MIGTDLRDRLAAEIIGRRELKPSKSNGKVQFRCPRHDDRNPSAFLGDHAWGCLSCGFTEPLSTLAEWLGVDVPVTGYTVEQYADEKALPLPALRSFGVDTDTSNGRAVVAIPYFDGEGRLLRRRFRAPGKKWWEGRNRPIYLYGIDRLAGAENGEPVLVVEGESDCHAAWVHGFRAVGVPGATTWRHDWAASLEGLQVFVWEEPDQGGPQLVASVARDFPDARVIQPPKGVKDLADLHKQRGKDTPDALRGLMAQAVKIGTPKPPVAFDALLGDHAEDLLRRKLAPIDAVQTPFPTWNQCCAGEGGRVGIARGWHVVAAARTGAGKSILAVNIAAEAVRCGERVCFVSLEMSQPEIETRFLAIAAGADVKVLEQGRHFSVERFRTATAYVAGLYERTGGTFYCNREPIHDLASVLDSIRYNADVNGSRFFIVDYLQLAGNAMEPETIVEVSHEVRKLAKDLNVVTVGLSQFNRQTSASKDRPQKEGLLGGSSLETDADQILLIDHSRMERPSPPLEGWVSYALLDKNRHGPAAEIPMHFDSNTLRMRERMPDELPSYEAGR